jgi:hypothetical protein
MRKMRVFLLRPLQTGRKKSKVSRDSLEEERAVDQMDRVLLRGELEVMRDRVSSKEGRASKVGKSMTISRPKSRSPRQGKNRRPNGKRNGNKCRK